MSRLFLSLAVLAILGAGLQFLPRPDAIRLAATQAGQLLREPARPGPASPSADGLDDAGALPLWRHLTEGPAARKTEEGRIELRVRGYRMDLAQTGYRDQRLHARFFESVKRSLRSIAAEEGFEIVFVERSRKDFPGVLLSCHPQDGELVIQADQPDGSVVHARREWNAPGPLSVAPSLFAIAFAMLLRRPLLALGGGVLVGAVLERTMRGASWIDGVGSGGARLVTRYIGGELFEPTRQQIALFLVFMLAMVGIVTRAGGIRGLMRLLARWAGTVRRCQAVTFLMGLLVFFDHYANTVLVGSTMRPLTDRLKVAREKLAYLVDSTAAPVAGLSIFSTWIAFEVSTFSVQLPEAGMAASQGYEVFLRTLPFRFYSLFTLFFVALVVVSGRDFGPMLRAERRARRGEVLAPGARPLASSHAVGLEPDESVVPLARTALLPLFAFVATTLVAILVRGGAFGGLEHGALLSIEGVAGVVFRGSGAMPLLLGALAGLLVAAFQARLAGLGGRIATAAWAGVRRAGTALGLLCLAWMLGAICHDMGTAAYLSVLLQEALNPLLLPMLLFVLSGVIAFSTGSSWSTMTILLPLVVGLSFEAGQSTPIGGEGMLVVAIASVLEGAIFGDHCSPISDTTVMSSIAASSDHVDHVRTQAPYAALTMIIALVCGYYPAVIVGLSPVVSLLLGAGALTAFLFFYGRRSETANPARREQVGAPGFQG